MLQGYKRAEVKVMKDFSAERAVDVVSLQFRGEAGGSLFFTLSLVKGALKRTTGEHVVSPAVGGTLGWCMTHA